MSVNLANIVRSATPSTGVQFRAEPYGKKGIRRFLRDVVALANAPVDGSRFIVVGAEIDKKGVKRLTSVSRDDFSGKPSYQAAVSDFTEPPIRLKYQPVTVDGKRVGVFVIDDCQDPPYMMRVDHSETLRRGDAYIRVDNSAIKMGRRQLQEMFERKFRDSVSADRVEVGFPGEIIHKDVRLNTVDLGQLPSVIANKKLKQLIDVQKKVKNSGSTTVMVRMMHARLFGSDSPYENRTTDELVAELAQLEEKHCLDDEHFLFETNAQEIQLVVLNQGDEPIRNAALSIVLPDHDAFHVADKLPKLRRNGEYVDRARSDATDYPTVNLKDDVIHVSNTLGEIPSYAPLNAFAVPLRICVGSDLQGRKLGIRYSLFGSNLRTPAKGRLRLLF